MTSHYSDVTLQWRHDERDGISNHRRLHCLLSRLFRRRSKKTSKFRAAVLCKGNSLVTGQFPSQRGSNAENVWWRHHEFQHKDLYGRSTPYVDHRFNSCNFIERHNSSWLLLGRSTIAYTFNNTNCLMSFLFVTDYPSYAFAVMRSWYSLSQLH